MRTSAWIGGVALASLTMGSAFAGSFDLTGYSLPTDGPFPTVTVTGTADASNGYNDYVGIIDVTTSTNKEIETFCTDLDHYLQTGTPYTTGLLQVNGLGQSVSADESSAIGQIAEAGFKGDNDMQIAAQAAIWVIEYGGPTSAKKVKAGTVQADGFYDIQQVKDYNTFISNYENGLYDGMGEAEVLLPLGNWWESGGASQELVFGSAPEPSTWAMMGLGFAGLGFAGYRKTKAKPAFA